MSNEVFRDTAEPRFETWRVKFKGRVPPMCWSSKAAAEKGLRVLERQTNKVVRVRPFEVQRAA